jgi:hypothetical protein
MYEQELFRLMQRLQGLLFGVVLVCSCQLSEGQIIFLRQFPVGCLESELGLDWLRISWGQNLKNIMVTLHSHQREDCTVEEETCISQA